MLRLSTGRWVSRDDFFNGGAELKWLAAQILDCNHTRLTVPSADIGLHEPIGFWAGSR